MVAINMLNASHVKLTRQDNFQEQKKQAKILLIMNKLWAQVLARVKKVVPIESLIDSNVIIHFDSALIATWKAKDEIALAFIHMTIDNVVDQTSVNVVSSKYARDTFCIVMSKAKLFTIKFVDPITTFLSSIKEINNEMTTLAKSTSNENHVTLP